MVKVSYADLLPEPIRARIQAVDVSAEGKKPVVGRAEDCEARDEATHEIILRPGVETQVPVLLDDEFSGKAIEIQVVDSRSEVTWARLRLKNAMVD